jgi:hypothetical protein
MNNILNILKNDPIELLVFSLVMVFFGAILFFLSSRISDVQYLMLMQNIERLNRTLNKMVKVLRLRKPGPIFVRVYEGEDSMLKFVLVLPQKGAADVVQRELTVQVGEGDPVVVSLGGDEVESGTFEGEDGDSVSGSLVDVDDAGNKSEAREFSFVLVDTVAPPTPGEVGLKVTEEV